MLQSAEIRRPHQQTLYELIPVHPKIKPYRCIARRLCPSVSGILAYLIGGSHPPSQALTPLARPPFPGASAARDSTLARFQNEFGGSLSPPSPIPTNPSFRRAAAAKSFPCSVAPIRRDSSSLPIQHHINTASITAVAYRPLGQRIQLAARQTSTPIGLLSLAACRASLRPLDNARSHHQLWSPV